MISRRLGLADIEGHRFNGLPGHDVGARIVLSPVCTFGGLEAAALRAGSPLERDMGGNGKEEREKTHIWLPTTEFGF